ncbi:MAG TPA: acyl-CoA dehydrogenase family protein [Quisquiliibacterium sp.]|nr:MAG: hypothetical protein E6Q93_29170 [Burkholderiaceae bacterium]HPA89362.1 acyl-CoA dehydrogenase family protein [Quisquiliibacterium sp.]HQN13608.1 acyl-CoA dehydrogenase family protein [Quisquiliibacterium sp.]
MPSFDDTAFRAEVRRFLHEHLPADMAQRGRTDVHPTRADMLGITALLARKGWSVPHWPTAYGGPGWTPLQRQVFEEELMMAGAPPNNIQGVSLVGPVVYTYGTDAQKARFLPPIREGRTFWAQGFSEPNAGSDLASLRTRAVRDGDHYVVDGQKIWTSQAMLADWLFCLVRTDPAAKAQRGISFLLIPLDAPGITVRPIVSIDEGESLCEVFLEGVRVPADHLIGEEGRGWDYAKFLLGNERVATAEVPRNKRNLAALVTMATRARRGRAALIDDPVFRDRVTQAEIDLRALEAAAVATLEAGDDSALTPSALKLQGCELLQRILGLQVETLGAHGAVFHPHDTFQQADGTRSGPDWAPGVTAEFLFRRAATIYGGSNEVQRNIIAKLLFSGQRPAPPARDESQTMLEQSAQRFAAPQRAPATRRARIAGGAATARAGWAHLCKTGFTALGIDEALGGMGGSSADQAVLFEALGRNLSLDPVAGCAVAPAALLAAADWPPEQRAALLGEIIEGRQIVAFADLDFAQFGLAHLDFAPPERAHPEFADPERAVPERAAPGRAAPGRADPERADPERANGGPSCRPESDGTWVLEGHCHVIPGGAIADAFLVTARSAHSGDCGVFLVERGAPGVQCADGRAIDGQPLADLALRGVRVAAASVVLAPGPAAHAALGAARDRITALSCADAVAAMDEALWITVDYLGTRRQFGAALADFQALRHRIADMYAELAMARAAARLAVTALDGPAAERSRYASLAKVRVARAGAFVGAQAIQLHGGIGMTDECAIGHYYKRLFAFERIGGDTHAHARRFAALG